MNINLEARRLAQEAVIRLNSGDIETGASLVQQALAFDPLDAIALNAKGLFFLQTEKPWPALQFFHMALRAMEKSKQAEPRHLDPVRRNIDLAVSRMIAEGLALLGASRPAGAARVFYQVLEFSLENPALKKHLLSALEESGEIRPAVAMAKTWALELVNGQTIGQGSMECLADAIRVFQPSYGTLAFVSAKALLLERLSAQGPNKDALRALKKVIFIFVP